QPKATRAAHTTPPTRVSPSAAYHHPPVVRRFRTTTPAAHRGTPACRSTGSPPVAPRAHRRDSPVGFGAAKPEWRRLRPRPPPPTPHDRRRRHHDRAEVTHRGRGDGYVGLRHTERRAPRRQPRAITRRPQVVRAVWRDRARVAQGDWHTRQVPTA